MVQVKDVSPAMWILFANSDGGETYAVYFICLLAKRLPRPKSRRHVS